MPGLLRQYEVPPGPSWETFDQLEEWMAEHGRLVWDEAVVDITGLTLICNAMEVALRFVSLPCGFEGGGPKDTARFLGRLGLNEGLTFEGLYSRLHQSQSCRFTI